MHEKVICKTEGKLVNTASYAESLTGSIAMVILTSHDTEAALLQYGIINRLIRGCRCQLFQDFLVQLQRSKVMLTNKSGNIFEEEK